jgi:hypothetical protein
VSRIGDVVSGKTLREIIDAAAEARVKLTLPVDGRLAVPMGFLLEKRVEPILQVQIDIRDDQDVEMSGLHAVYSLSDRVLKLRESVVRSCAIEEPEALFTVCHEIGHIWLHSDTEYFRRNEPSKLPKKTCDPEWQADMFSVAFMSDLRLFESSGYPLQALLHCRVPKTQALRYITELESAEILAKKQETLADRNFRNAIQDGFDF